MFIKNIDKTLPNVKLYKTDDKNIVNYLNKNNIFSIYKFNNVSYFVQCNNLICILKGGEKDNWRIKELN